MFHFKDDNFTFLMTLCWVKKAREAYRGRRDALEKPLSPGEQLEEGRFTAEYLQKCFWRVLFKLLNRYKWIHKGTAGLEVCVFLLKYLIVGQFHRVLATVKSS